MSHECRYNELLNELNNELSSLQKLKLRISKQHNRVKNNVIETFDSLLQSLRDRRTTLLNTLNHITEQIESQLAIIETTISADVTSLQHVIQHERDVVGEEIGFSRESERDSIYQTVLTNNQKRSLSRQTPDVSFRIDPHFQARAPLVGSITRSQGVLASESVSKPATGPSQYLPDQTRLARAPGGNFYLLDARENLIHLVSPDGELLHTVALHITTRLHHINQFYHQGDKFYVTSRQYGALKVFLRNGQLLHSLSTVGYQPLADPHGMGHTSTRQLVIANTARHSLLICHGDLSTAISIGEHSYQPHTLLPSPKYLAVDENDCIYTVSSQHNTLFVVTTVGETLYEMSILDLPHPIRSLSLTPTGDILVHTCSHSKRGGAPGTALCLLRPRQGQLERLHLKGLTRTRVSDLCVTDTGVVVILPEASTQLMLLSRDIILSDIQ